MMVSICVSIHNMESSLRYCLDSLVNQTIKEKEIILVNNGSTDGSQSIIDEYKEKYSEIKVVIQEDRGLAQGRKSGVDVAMGKYIAFVDADDKVDLQMYETMVNVAEQERAQIVECRIEAKGKYVTNYPVGIFDTKEMLKDYFLNKSIYPMLWFRIYHKSLFESPVFPNLYTNNEDEFVFPCLLYRAEKIVRIPNVFYYYTVDNVNSVMHKYKINDRGVLERRKVVIKCAEHIKEVIGAENIDMNFREEYQAYLLTIAEIILFGRYSFLGIEERLGIINDVMGLDEKKINYIARNYQTQKSYVNRLIKIFGIRVTIWMFIIKRKLVKDKG